MADGVSNSDENQMDLSNNVQSSNLHEFRDMVDVALNLDLPAQSNNDNISIDEQSLDQALLSLDTCESNQQINSINTATTSVSVAELPSDIADSFNVAAKHLSLLYGSVLNPTAEEDEESIENLGEGEEIYDNFAEPCLERTAASSTIAKPTTINNPPQQKRHIMISYNRSSREICQKIYDGLIERDYKVWMDLTDMGDDILVSMARAVENSYIVLLCINQKYYESDYCRLEAEYAAENRIKFIPCLMEKSFRPESWLGIIKGSNVHIDFSSPEDFQQSFDELIRQITHVEKRLALQPRRTPAPVPMINPMKLATMSTPKSPTSTLTNDVNSRRFDAIMREYKRSIKTNHQHVNQLKRNELSDLIVKLRQELFTETSQVLSDDEDEKQTIQVDERFLQQLLTRSLDQNELLLRLVDRLTTPQPVEQPNSRNLDLDGIIKVILAVMLLYTLTILCQKE